MSGLVQLLLQVIIIPCVGIAILALITFIFLRSRRNAKKKDLEAARFQMSPEQQRAYEAHQQEMYWRQQEQLQQEQLQQQQQQQQWQQQQEMQTLATSHQQIPVQYPSPVALQPPSYHASVPHGQI